MIQYNRIYAGMDKKELKPKRGFFGLGLYCPICENQMFKEEKRFYCVVCDYEDKLK